MKISATTGVNLNKNQFFKINQQTTPPWEMDIFESCEPKPIIVRKSLIKGKHLDQVCFRPNIYESSTGLLKTRKILNSQIAKVEGFPNLELKISDSKIGEINGITKIHSLKNVEADKINADLEIALWDNNKVNSASTSLMLACGSEINHLKCDTLKARDSFIHYAYVRGNSDRFGKQFINIYNTTIKNLNINPKGEYSISNSHIDKLIIPEGCKTSINPYIVIKKYGNSVIESFENKSNHHIAVAFYKDGDLVNIEKVPPNTCYDKKTIEKYF